MPRIGSNKNAQELLKVLTEWRYRHRIEDDPYLNGLIASLETNSNIDKWVNLQPLQWLPFPNDSTINKLSAFVRILSLLRNILILLPVAVTWYAIGQATSAFAIFVETGGEATVNFLDFWQNGYEVLDEKWRISEVALFDVYLIGLVVILTFMVGIFQNIVFARQDNFSRQIESERTAISLLIQDKLKKYREPTPLSISQDFSYIVDKLTLLTSEMLRQMQAQNQSTVLLANFNKNLKVSDKTLSNLNNTFSKPVLINLRKSVKNLEKLIKSQKSSRFNKNK